MTPSTGLGPAGRLGVTVFGLGFCKPFSGTWGSLPPIALGAGMLLLGFGPADNPWIWGIVMVLIFVIASLACVVFGDAAEAHFHQKDPGQVVADEVAGQALALALLPAAAFGSWLEGLFTLALSFVAFRLFDILKPPPASWLQRAPGGWGILLDDLAAGLYAVLLVTIAWSLSGGS